MERSGKLGVQRKKGALGTGWGGGGAVGKKVHSKQRDKRPPLCLTHKDRAMPLLRQVPEESESHPFFSTTQGASGADAVKTMSGMRLRPLTVTLMCLPLLRVTVP